jgi:3-dehydroquinate synthase
VKREILSGIAEVIKYAVIHDYDFYFFLRKNRDHILKLHMPTVKTIIEKSCTIKANIVSKDETERGIRTNLNFGHTIAHALETVTGYRIYKHGEAVAIGMAAAARMSAAWGFCSFETSDNIKQLIEMFGLRTMTPKYSYKNYIKAIQKDKKKSGNDIMMVLPAKIGEVIIKKIKISRIENAFRNKLI